MGATAQAVETWVKANSYAADRDTGSSRISISFDTVRMHFYALPGNNVLLEARVCDLPASIAERDRVLDRAMAISAGRLRDNHAALTSDDQQTALWLQRRLPGSIAVDKLDLAVERLVNEVEMWRAVL